MHGERIESFLASRAFFRLTAAIFAVQAIGVAGWLGPRVAPDEIYHRTYIEAYADHLSPIITEQEGYFILGDIERNPSYLYHYALSFPYRLLSSLVGEKGVLIALRLLNTLFALAALAALKALGEELFGAAGRLPTNLAVLLVSTLPMFLLLAGVVNYDNAVFALTSWSLVFLARVVSSPGLRDSSILGALLLAGTIVKFAFLPLALGIAAVAAYSIARAGKISDRSRPSKATLAALAVTAVLLLLNLERHGINLLRYQSISPRCDLVHSHAECLEREVYRRERQIEAAGPPPGLKPVHTYAVVWTEVMLAESVGVVAHRAFEDSLYLRIWFLVLSAAAAFETARRIDFRRDKRVLLLAAALLPYLIALFVNSYVSYRRTGLVGIAIQGRYAFPALLPMLLIGYCHLFRVRSPRFRLVLIAFALLGALLGGLPNLLLGSNSDWWIL